MKTQILETVKSSNCKPLTDARINRYTKAMKSADEWIKDCIEYGDDMNLPMNREFAAEKAICEVALETKLDPLFCQKEISKITGFSHSVLFHA